MKKICQSCGMPLIDGQIDRRGTEADGTRSEKFCNLCYLNGKYNDPYITKEEMINKGISGIENQNMSKFKKWFLVKSYPSLIKNLERWK